jgi:hypothetical protein
MCREWSGSPGVGGGRVLPMPLVVEVVIFGFREKMLGAHKVWPMLLPLITKGLLREALRKSTATNTMGWC